MSVSVVVQRFRECKLLIDELEYVTVGGGEECCGILAYVSFAGTTTKTQVEQAALTLLNLPVLTTGLWGDGESSTASLLSLAADSASSVSLVIVPQANLTSKVRQQGKSIQYHGQIDKEKGQEYYKYFCDCLRGLILEAQCSCSAQELPDWYIKRKALMQSDNKQSSATPSTPPDQLFHDKSKYSAWDEKGFPIKDVEGNDITKSQAKKLSKVYDAHVKRHNKWKEQQQEDENGNANNAAGDGAGPPPAMWNDSLDPSFCHFVEGSFGKRQGLELRSDMGPFVHSFQV